MSKKYKNDIINKIIIKGKNVNPHGTPMDICMTFIGGYMSSLFEVASWKEVNVDIDITYATIKNLSLAVAWNYNACINSKIGYSKETSLDIAEKSIASYLICLAINEENASIIANAPSAFTKDFFDIPDRWSGFEILSKYNGKTIDFLKEVRGSIIHDKNGLTIYMDKAIKAYKQLVGKDLSEYGLDSLNVENI